MSRYTVTFYQVAVVHDSETCNSKAAAVNTSQDFLDGFKGMPGHHREGSLWNDNYARYVDGSGATEAMASITKIDDERAR